MLDVTPLAASKYKKNQPVEVSVDQNRYHTAHWEAGEAKTPRSNLKGGQLERSSAKLKKLFFFFPFLITSDDVVLFAKSGGKSNWGPDGNLSHSHSLLTN